METRHKSRLVDMLAVIIFVALLVSSSELKDGKIKLKNSTIITSPVISPEISPISPDLIHKETSFILEDKVKDDIKKQAEIVNKSISKIAGKAAVVEFKAGQQTDGLLKITAPTFLSVFVDDKGNEKILLEKNKDKKFPIASITKLITALVAREKYKDDDVIEISKNNLKIAGLSGIYKVEDRFLFSDALHALLIASHNEIASAFAEQIGTREFITLMNEKSQKLQLLDTVFFNESGLDPDRDTKQIKSEEINRSTAYEVYKLARYIQENHPDLLSITTQKEFDLYDVDQNLIAKIKSTNKLLGQPDARFIIGGKTGKTDRAKENLVIVSKSPCGGKIISIVLGSQNNFEDMKELFAYAYDSYSWACAV